MMRWVKEIGIILQPDKGRWILRQPSWFERAVDDGADRWLEVLSMTALTAGLSVNRNTIRNVGAIIRYGSSR